MPQQKRQGFAPKTARRGVTLVEIAIVLVIIGLLLGGVLKGQELINNAKVRAIADRQNSLKVAWFSFVDRFQALPGDYVFADQYIPGAAAKSAAAPITGDGIINENESPRVLQNLTGAGYLRCPQCNDTTVAGIAPAAVNSLQNSYGGVMGIFTNGFFTNAAAAAAPTYLSRGNAAGGARLMVHTGSRIPSNIVAEVDRKIDDGIANEGDVVFNSWIPGKAAPGAGQSPTYDCTTKVNNAQTPPTALFLGTSIWWRHAVAPVDQNCGASVNI